MTPLRLATRGSAPGDAPRPRPSPTRSRRHRRRRRAGARRDDRRPRARTSRCTRSAARACSSRRSSRPCSTVAPTSPCTRPRTCRRRPSRRARDRRVLRTARRPPTRSSVDRSTSWRPGATVATGSVRRRRQLGRARPDLQFVELRGNIQTRLTKVPDGGAIVMAVAALEVLDLTDRIAEVLDPARVRARRRPGLRRRRVPRRRRRGRRRCSPAIDHAATRRAVEVERAFLAELGSGCSLPVGAHVDGAQAAHVPRRRGLGHHRVRDDRVDRRRPNATSRSPAARRATPTTSCRARDGRRVDAAASRADDRDDPRPARRARRAARRELGADVVHVPLIEIAEAPDGGGGAWPLHSIGSTRSIGSS